MDKLLEVEKILLKLFEEQTNKQTEKRDQMLQAEIKLCQQISQRWASELSYFHFHLWCIQQRNEWLVHVTCVDRLTEAWAIKKIEMIISLEWRWNKAQEGAGHVIQKLIPPLHFLHPSKPQRPNKTTRSETEVWLWKMAVLRSSLWGGYEIQTHQMLSKFSCSFPGSPK